MCVYVSNDKPSCQRTVQAWHQFAFQTRSGKQLTTSISSEKKKTCERRLSDELTLALTIKILMTKLLPTAVQAACHGTTMFPNAQEPTTVSLSGREYAEKFKLWNSGFGGYGNMMVQKIPQTLV